MKKPNPQRLIMYLVWLLAGVVFVGNIADAIGATTALLAPPTTYYVLAATLVVWLCLEIYLRFRPVTWTDAGGQPSEIGKPTSEIRWGFLGILILLAISVVINHSSAEEESDKSCFPPDVYSLLPVAGSMTIDFSYHGDLNADHRNEIAIISSISNSETHRDVFVDVLECQGNDNWRNIFHKALGNLVNCGHSAAVVEIGVPEHKQILIENICGSGAYLDYWLIGYGARDRVQVLLSDEGLFQGSAVIQQGRLVVGSGDKAWNYSWNGKDFEAGTGGIVPESNSVIVNYWMENGLLQTDAPITPVHLAVGQTLYLRRQVELDDSDDPVRALLSDGRIGDFGFEGQYMVLVPHSSGTVTVTLVPNGYDWERSIDILVRIE